MEVVRLVILLLVQLSSIFVHVNGKDETVYICNGNQASDVTVTKSTALLTKGCVLDDKGITFVLSDMYKKDDDPVVINISEAVFISSHIKLINAHRIRSNVNRPGPLQLTMSNSEMSGTSEIDFGGEENERVAFKLPPHSRISILHSKMKIDTKDSYSSLFNFYSLQLVTGSSMEIAKNVITMEYKGKTSMTIFYIRPGMNIIFSDGSTFTLRDNEINMNACCGEIVQVIWYQVISNVIVTTNSKYTWASNNISMIVNGGESQAVYQYVWYTLASTNEITSNSQLLIHSNRILLLAENYAKLIKSSVMLVSDPQGTSISLDSSVEWRDNCIGMGHKKGDKRNVFIGNWSVTSHSELQLDKNYFVTTDLQSDDVEEFLWGPKSDRYIRIINGVKKEIDTTVRRITTLKNEKALQSICAGLPDDPDISKSATAVLSTITGVLITVILLLYSNM